jgi:hypothetical protein
MLTRLGIVPFIALALSFAASNARADYTAHICRAPKTGPVKALVRDNACVGYEVRGKRVRFSYPGSGQLIASSDGRTVVMLQSYLPGGINAKGEIEQCCAPTVTNPVGVHIYRDGKEVAAHRMNDLIARKRLLKQSTSHVIWVRRARITKDRFTIATTDFRSLRFDIRSGKLLRAEDAPEWKRCDVIATGQLDLKRSRLEKPFLYKRGQRHHSPLPFELAPGLARTSLTHHASIEACFVRRGKTFVLSRIF